MLVAELFTTVVYQPFFNVLVFLYWLLEQSGYLPDMGVAVILLTLVIRFLLLPLSFSSHKSEAERREIAAKLAAAEEEFGGQPMEYRKQRKRIIRSHQSLINSEIVSFFIQAAISLMLWRIFETGLKGQDIHLIYPFMPGVELPFNLVFLGRYDLTHTSFQLNILQSLLIFILETLSIYTSPYPPAKGEVVRLQLVLPIVSFLIFMRLPAGKKLFIITSLVVSVIITFIKFTRRKFLNYKEKIELKRAADDQVESVLVDTK